MQNPATQEVGPTTKITEKTWLPLGLVISFGGLLIPMAIWVGALGVRIANAEKRLDSQKDDERRIEERTDNWNEFMQSQIIILRQDVAEIKGYLKKGQ